VSKQGSGRNAIALVDETLALSSYRARCRHLRARREHFSPPLLHELVARAHVVLDSDPGEAAQRARLAELVAEALADEEGRLDSLRALAHAYILQGRFPFGLKGLEAAGALLREHGDHTRIQELDILRPQPRRPFGHYDELCAIAARSLALFEERGDREGAICTHLALAHLALRMDRPRDALRHYARIDRLARFKTSTRFWGTLAANRASALVAGKRYRAAARHLGLARQLLAEAGCDHLVAQVDYNTAYAEALRGRYGAALRHYAKSEPVFKRIRDSRYLALLDLHRAEIHLALHRHDEALRFAARACKRFAALQMEREHARATLLAGRAADLRGNLEEAEIRLRNAGEMFARVGLREQQVDCLVEAGTLALRSGRLEQARMLTSRAEALADELETHPCGARLALLRGHLDIAAGDTSRALQRADTVRVRFRGVHAPWIQSEAQRLEGAAYVARNQLGEAILAFKYAIEELEGYCGEIPADAACTAPAKLYARIVSLLVRAGHFEEAFGFAERAKSRALVALLATRPRGDLPLVRDARTARRLHRLRLRLGSTYDRLARSLAAASAGRLHARDREHERGRLLEAARARDRESVSLEAVDTLDLPTVRDDLAPGTVLLDYLVTDDAVLIFVVTPRSFRVVRQEVPAAELRRLLERFRFHLAKFDQRQFLAEELVLQATRANLDQLAAHLLAPVAENLDGDRLVIAPDGLLHHVPFHALPWGDGWVADRFEVVYAPSAAVYRFGRDRPVNTAGPACILALPDEVGAAREVQSVARALASEDLHLGEQATLARLRETVRRARVLHLVTDITSQREQPLGSAIRLADTWLSFEDLYRLETSAELVVLSTGDGGLQEVTESRSVLALVRGFLYAGAQALLASRWRVHDETSAELMDRFYHHWQEQGDAATALKQAMAEVRAHRPHPYHWAPYFLAGRPVARVRRPAARRHTRARVRAVSRNDCERGSS
jgi:CHAT domain-containing protein